MPAKLSKLAKKYKQALDDADAARQAAEAARAEWLAEATEARTALFAELAEFAVAAGLEAAAGRGRLALTWGGRSLVLSNGDGGDTIETDAGVAIVLQPDGEWVANGEAFVDRGLRRLLVDALGVPDPEGEFTTATPVKAAAPAKAAPAQPAAAKPAAPAKAAAKPAAPAKVEKAPPPKEFTPAEPQVSAAQQGDGKGPSSGDLGHMGRSGTRGFKRSKDISPGSVIKDFKGPGPV